MAWPTASSARRKGRPLNAKLAVRGKSIVANKVWMSPACFPLAVAARAIRWLMAKPAVGERQSLCTRFDVKTLKRCLFE
jgi:hypothetical protein